MKGRLFVVATPVGNLEDITLRALRILGEAEAVACEDTRRTLKLLNRHGIKKKLISYFQPRENMRLPEIMSILRQGKDVALVSDAGTPGISDPGFPLIRQAIKEDFKVIPVPGPSAVIASLSASGLPSHRFLFLGFPPPKKAALLRMLESVAEEPGTLVFYLPARKTAAFLENILEKLGDRRIVIARELSKLNEEFIRGTAGQLSGSLQSSKLKGELTVLVEGRTRRLKRLD